MQLYKNSTEFVSIGWKGTDEHSEIVCLFKML